MAEGVVADSYMPAAQDAAGRASVKKREAQPLLGRIWRRLKIMYFQYEISFAAYCFSWWEKILVHIILLSALALVTWGTWRFGILGTLQLMQSTAEQLQTLRQQYSWVVPQIRRWLVKGEYHPG